MTWKFLMKFYPGDNAIHLDVEDFCLQEIPSDLLEAAGGFHHTPIDHFPDVTPTSVNESFSSLRGDQDIQDDRFPQVTTLFALLLNNLDRVSQALVPNFELLRSSIVNSPLPQTRKFANKPASLPQARPPPTCRYPLHPLAIASSPRPPHLSLQPSQGALKAHLARQHLGNPRRSGTTAKMRPLPPGG